jgi:hypothetical protein
MSTFEEQLSALKQHLAIVEQEVASLKAGRKSAAPRLRKSLMDLKNGSHTMRLSAMTFVKELPTKSRTLKSKSDSDVPAEAP